VKTGKTNPKSFDANFTNFREFGEGKSVTKERKELKVQELCGGECLPRIFMVVGQATRITP
jgi:hypothetical protein